MPSFLEAEEGERPVGGVESGADDALVELVPSEEIEGSLKLLILLLGRGREGVEKVVLFPRDKDMSGCVIADESAPT